MAEPGQIVLTGMMGAGKSSVAAALGKLLGRRVFDLDDEISMLAGKPIPEIFEKDGEPHFRHLEVEAFRQLESEKGAVIALGGGAFCSAALREAVGERGVSVYLHAELSELVARLRAARGDRPLLDDHGWELKLQELFQTRDPIYRTADHLVATTGKTVADVATEVADATA